MSIYLNLNRIVSESKYYIKFDAENDNLDNFTISIDKEDIETYLNCEHGFINSLDQEEQDEDVLKDASQDILNSFLRGGTTYEITIQSNHTALS